MTRKKSRSSSLIPILILIAAVLFWVFDSYKAGSQPSPSEKRNTNVESGISSTGDYKTFENCSLIDDRGNDGDSFKAKLPNGRVEIFRLYFVDAPESAFKTYGNGENNHSRIGHQATDLGNITPQQAVEIGKDAKDYTLSLLEKNSFTIHTKWDSPFKDQRYHAFIEFDGRFSPNFLHERLVTEGLARIHTKGAA